MKKILFIEDEAALQKTLGELLRGEGYEVVSAIDGESGLRLAKEIKPDLILLDLILPKILGLKVLENLKSDPETKEIPVIILTNIEDTAGIEKAIELGATTYLVKANYSLEEVVEKVKQAIGE
jgi:CheY-like chemotaxis protein